MLDPLFHHYLPLQDASLRGDILGLAQRAGIKDLTHVPYNGVAPALQGLKSQEVQACTLPYSALVRNLVLAVRVLRRERPDVIVSTGAGAAVPFFWIGRLLRCRTVFLEVFDRVDSATLTGRLCAPVTDLMLVQWPDQQRLYRRAVVAGTVY